MSTLISPLDSLTSICDKFHNDYHKTLGQFNSKINMAKNKLLKPVNDGLALLSNTPNKFIPQIGNLVDDITDQVNSAISDIEDLLNGPKENIEKINKLLQCLGASIPKPPCVNLTNYYSTNIFNQLNNLPSFTLAAHLPALQSIVPIKMIDKLLQMTFCLLSNCGSSVDPISIEDALSEIGLNINNELDLTSPTFNSISLSKNAKGYLDNLVNIGNKINDLKFWC